MKQTLLAVLISASLLFPVASAFAQQSETDQLKATIQRLEEIERDSTTPAEVKQLNHGFLVMRRQQLQALLQKRLKDLQSYQSKIGASLSKEENAVLDFSIRNLTQELNNLRSETMDDVIARQPRADVDATPPVTTAQPVVPPQTTAESSSNSAALFTRPILPMSSRTTPLEAASVEPARMSASAPVADDDAALDCSLFIKQPKTFSIVDRYICNLAKEVKSRKTGDPRRGLAPAPTAGLDLDADFIRLVIIVDAKKGRAEELVRAEEARVDKQVGGGSSNAGTTSLVTKGNVPAILGFATEHGALTQENDGTTITFRGNPVGMVKAFSGLGL
ncbi:MAG TPA: hypothetical protein VMZ30_19725, partial [Pyrinomonadaceae bacterium]|nr:hypothetical protein [Pyrinomonadaceae bacterium]